MSIDWKKLRKKILTFSTEILPKIPQRGDSALTVFIKFMSIADSLDKNLAKDSALSSFFSQVTAENKENAQFVDLFYSTALRNTFKIKKLSISEYCDIVIAEDSEIGTLYFIEYRWSGKPEPSSDFWYSPDFKFEKALERMWAIYQGGIDITLRIERERIKTAYEGLEFTTDPLLGDAQKRFDKALALHKSYVDRGFPRTYLYIGKQGGGKSTFATRLSQACGNRTLRIDTKGMTVAGATDIGFIISGMRPTFLILDDIDRVSDTSTIPMLLAVMAKLKDKHRSVTCVLTANSLEPFDPAFLRPGRVDKIIEFEDPGPDEREKILRGYLNEFGAQPGVDLKKLAKATKGLTPAYLRELAVQLQCESVAEVLATIKQMHRLSKKNEVPPPPGGPEPAAPPGTPPGNLTKAAS